MLSILKSCGRVVGIIWLFMWLNPVFAQVKNTAGNTQPDRPESKTDSKAQKVLSSLTTYNSKHHLELWKCSDLRHISARDPELEKKLRIKRNERFEEATKNCKKDEACFEEASKSGSSTKECAKDEKCFESGRRTADTASHVCYFNTASDHDVLVKQAQNEERARTQKEEAFGYRHVWIAYGAIWLLIFSFLLRTWKLNQATSAEVERLKARLGEMENSDGGS